MKDNTGTRNLRLVTLNLDYDDIKEYKEIIGKDLSKSVRDLIKRELDEQKEVEAPNRLPILTSDVRQTTITEYAAIHIKALLETSEESLLCCYKQDEEMMADLRHKLSEASIKFRHPNLVRK